MYNMRNYVISLHRGGRDKKILFRFIIDVGIIIKEDTPPVINYIHQIYLTLYSVISRLFVSSSHIVAVRETHFLFIFGIRILHLHRKYISLWQWSQIVGIVRIHFIREKSIFIVHHVLSTRTSYDKCIRATKIMFVSPTVPYPRLPYSIVCDVGAFWREILVI